MKYPINKDQQAYMRQRQIENRALSKANPNELWMRDKLKGSGHKWTRQARWGYRLLDFWCHDLGIAIEVDGPEHDKDYDEIRDSYNLNRSGILVLRVRNRNEQDAEEVLRAIRSSETWNERRAMVGAKPIKT